MLAKGMHPTIIAESFLKASAKAVEYLGEISTPVDLKDKATLLRAASTSLNSKAWLFLSTVKIELLTNATLTDRIPIRLHIGSYRGLLCNNTGNP